MAHPKPVTFTQIQSTIQKRFGKIIEFGYLLGSAGTKRFNAESDIDLGLYWKKIPPFTKLAKIKSELSELFDTEIDLVTLNSIDPIFGRQVLETGRLLVENSAGIHLNWKTNQLSQYPDFKFSRKIIENKILNRKRYV